MVGDLDQLMLIGFVAMVVLLLFATKVSGADWLEPAPIFLAGWTVVGGFLAMRLVVYDQMFTGASFLSLVLGITAFCAATIVMRWRHRRYRPRTPVDALSLTLSPVSWIFLVCGCCVYLILEGKEIADFVAGGGFESISLVELREEHTLQTLEARATAASIAKAVARVAATIAAVGVPIFLRTRRWTLLCTGAAAIAALSAESLLAGGRIMLAYVALGALYAFVHLRRGTGSSVSRVGVLRIMVAGMTLVVMSYAMLVVFPAARNPALVDNVDLFLGLLHDARVSPWVYRLSEWPVFAALPVFAFASSYLSQPIVKYAFFLQNGSIENWYHMGAYNFPVLAKIGSALTDSPSKWGDIRGEIASISTGFGYAENPWATGVRDLVIDFGFFGMVVALFIFGAFWQWLYERARKTSALEWQLVIALAVPMAFFFAFFSPLPIGVFGNTLSAAIVLAMGSDVQRRITDRRGGYNSDEGPAGC